MTRDELYAALQGITGGNFDELDLTRDGGEVIIKFFDIEEAAHDD